MDFVLSWAPSRTWIPGRGRDRSHQETTSCLQFLSLRKTRPFLSCSLALSRFPWGGGCVIDTEIETGRETQRETRGRRCGFYEPPSLCGFVCDPVCGGLLVCGSLCMKHLSM